jgi:hypothetical protein
MGGRDVPELSLGGRLELSSLGLLFDRAQQLCGHREFVILGSLSILGVVTSSEAPERMLMSIDVDCYTKLDPERIFELDAELGEGSPFEIEHGFYLDPVSPKLPTLPDQWEARLIRVPLESGITLYFLDPNDVAVSKYARCEPRDREWIQAGLSAGLLSGAIIKSRFRDTSFLDAAERLRATEALDTDRGGARPRRRRK